MNIHLSRKIIMGSNNKDVQKDLDRGGRFGNTSYPDELENTTGLILQYKKEKERELLRKKKYNNKFKNNKDNNNGNNNDRDNSNNDNKTETIGAIIQEDNNTRMIKRVLVMVNAGYNADGTLFDPEMDKKEYCNECDAQLNDDRQIG